MNVEAVTISDVVLSDKYEYVRTIHFKDRKYVVVIASNKEFAVGEEVLYIPDGTILPPYLIKQLGLWDSTENKGLLSGALGNTVRPYKYNGDKSYYSYGLIQKITDGKIETPYGMVDVHSDKLEQELGVQHIAKGLPWYFKGEMFLSDLKVSRPPLPELEFCYRDFENEWVYVEKILPGTRFSSVISQLHQEPNALGDHHNIFITTEGLKRYVFFARTKANRRSNLFVKMFDKGGYEKKADFLMSTYPGVTIVTFELTLRNTAYGNYRECVETADQVVVNDIFFGTVPLGRYLNRDEKLRVCRSFGLTLAPEIHEGEFNYDEIQQLAESDPVGVLVRNFDNTKRAYLYNREYRFTRVKPSR